MQAKPILFLFCLLISLSALAQSPCQPILSQAQAALNRGNTELALRKLQDVEICDDSNELIRQRQRLQNAIFDKVNEQRLAATKAQAEAEQERETARQALADLAASQERIQLSLDRAQRLADAIPFYDGKYAVRQGHVPGVDWHLFALGTPYHFIDKEGVSVDKLGLWRSAELFDEDGYAKVVTSGGISLLIDTTGENYSYTNQLSNLNNAIEIAFLGKTVPDSISYIAEKGPYLKVLILDGMEITPEVIPSLMKMLTDLDSLESLSLSRCNLTEIPPELLRLTNLRKLDLSVNSITTVPKELGQLQELRTLNLASNGLTAFPLAVIQLKNLEVVKLEWNEFTNYPPTVFELPKLVSLEFRNDTITQIPAAIGNMTQLRKLTLKCDSLQSLPASLTQLRQLDKINISGGKFTTFPTGISQLGRLEELRIVGTNLKQLPEGIGELQQLIILDVNNNKLEALPEGLCELRQLKQLKVYSNQLMHIPAEIGNLRRLTKFDFSNNALVEIPPSFGKLVNLTKINFTNNKLMTLPSEIGNFHRLSTLSLGANDLIELPAEIGQLSRLFTLQLGSNQLTTLPDEIGQLKELRYLWLENNKINSLPTEIGQLKKILGLYLEHNDAPSSLLETLADILPDFCKVSPRLEDVYKSENNYPKLYELQMVRTLDQQSEIVYDWVFLSKYSAFVGDNYMALTAAQKALSLDASHRDAEIALAFAYVLNDRWEEAEAIYAKWKGKTFWKGGPLADDSILSDLEELEAEGITHPDFANVRMLFEED